MTGKNGFAAGILRRRTKFSDLRFDGMAVEIRFNGIPIAEINKDKGLNMQEIEIPSPFSPDNAQFVFSLNDFLDVLQEAKKLLDEL